MDPFASPSSANLTSNQMASGQILSLSGGRGTKIRLLSGEKGKKYVTGCESVRNSITQVYEPRRILSVGDVHQLAAAQSQFQSPLGEQGQLFDFHLCCHVMTPVYAHFKRG